MILRRVIRRTHALARRALAAGAAATGQDLVERTPYSPVTRLAADDPAWDRRASLVGVSFDLDAQLEFLERELAPYVREFDPPHHDDGSGRFFLWNRYYQAVDAEVAYAMVRHLKPRRILEIGSGFSTLVLRTAAEWNARDGRPAEVEAVDAGPRPDIGGVRLSRRGAEDLPLDRYLELEDGDVLFVDSSHVVRVGSEVNRLVLDVLPRLRPGVVVHFHDVFLPYEYPRAFQQQEMFLSEQYLVHAFLIGNRDYEVVFAAHAASREQRDRVAAVVPSLRARADHHPAAFWIRNRRAPAE